MRSRSRSAEQLLLAERVRLLHTEHRHVTPPAEISGDPVRDRTDVLLVIEVPAAAGAPHVNRWRLLHVRFLRV